MLAFSSDRSVTGDGIYAMGFFPEADRCLGRATQLAPQSADTLFWSGLVLNRLGQTSRSTEHLTRVAGLDAKRRDECRYISARNHLRGDTADAVADTNCS